MIVVTVELHSAVTGQVKLLGKAIIANDGTNSDPSVGHYDLCVGRKGTADLKQIYMRPQRHSRVENYPRQKLSVWNLVVRGLAAAGYK